MTTLHVMNLSVFVTHGEEEREGWGGWERVRKSYKENDCKHATMDRVLKTLSNRMKNAIASCKVFCISI